MSEDDDPNARLSATSNSSTSDMTKKKKSKAATMFVETKCCSFFHFIDLFLFRAKDFRVRAVNLIRRRTTEATLSEKSLIPSREDVQSWQESFDALLRHRCKINHCLCVRAVELIDRFLISSVDTDGQALFRAFLRTEFSEENLEFWLACDEFRNCKEPKRSAKAKKIYMDFIATGAPKQVRKFWPRPFLVFFH